VIDNVVWIDSWLSIAGEEQARKVVAGEAYRFGEDKWAWVEGPDGQRGQVRAAWCKNNKMKSWTVFWLSLKTKVESRIRGSRVMSGDWRRLHRVRGVSDGSLENHWIPWLIKKAKTEEPKTEVQQLQTGLTDGSDRSDR
jgi:hypothetical protein